MTHIINEALQHKKGLDLLTILSAVLFVQTESGKFEILRYCSNPGCRSSPLDFSVKMVNGMRVSRNGYYCSQGCYQAHTK